MNVISTDNGNYLLPRNCQPGEKAEEYIYHQ